MEKITDNVADIIKNATQKHILPYYKHLSQADIATKSSATDLVTSADIAAENYITAELKKLLPKSIVIGEENAYKNPDVFQQISMNNDNTFWLIDPIDGTKNFVNGNDIFGTMISLVEKGKIVAGWIYIPLRDIFITPNTVFPKLSNPQELTSMQGTFSIKASSVTKYIANHKWWGSSAYSYAMLLMGDVDFAIFQRPVLQPWDHTAGVFFYQRLGGIAALANGSIYTPFPHTGTLILAPSQSIWNKLVAIIKQPDVTN